MTANAAPKPVATVAVVFSSSPWGAQVVVDGKTVGTTPVSNLDLTAGTHTVSAVLAARFDQAREAVGWDQAFSSACLVAPKHWTPAFGPELEGMAEGQTARVDGTPLPVPVDLEAGLYLVQAGEQGQGPVFSRIVMVPDEQTLVVRVEAPSGVGGEGEVVEASTERRSRKGTGWYVGAGAAALLSGTSALLAVAQNGGMDEATDLDALDAGYGRQKALAYGSYGLAGASAICLGIGLAW